MRATFDQMLSRVRAVYLGGRLLAAGLRLAAALLAAFLVAVLFDVAFAFDERTRMGLDIALLLGAAAGAGYALATILSLPRRAIAAWVDSQLPSRRRPAFSALELAAAPPPADGSALGRYLVDQALEQGRLAIAGRPAWRWLPRRLLRRAGLQWAAAAAAALLAAGLAPLRIHALRLLAPARDIPPWSRISFAVDPDHPRVIYGDSLEISATVSGPVGGEAIVFEMRDAEHAYRGAGFREATNRYVHRLERVVQPLRFCVRAGRARSPWHELTVLYQPRIASARVTLVPPAYAGLPPREFYLGGQKLAGLRGSRVTLDIVANRPLRRGALFFTHPDGSETRVAGEGSGDSSIRFAWTLEGDADVRIHVEDPLGTPNARTHVFAQQLQPDEPPAATLLEPPRYSLATPGSLIPVAGSAEDALGLRSVALVRNLVGFRDRALPVGVAAGAREAQLESALDLAMLGAQAGDSLELYVEAADTNPDLLGSAMSDVARIDVISPEEYAEILRLRTAVEEFGERYQLISRQLAALREALQAVAGAAAAPPEPETVRRALAAWRELDDSYRRAAEDFAIYDMEKQLPRVLDAIRAASAPLAERLADPATPPAEAPALARQWLEAIGDPAQELGRQAEDAALADQLVRVARSALELQQIIDRQAAVVRALSRYEANLRATPAALLAETRENQAAVAEMLETWFADTTALADALPPGQEELIREMRAVVDALRAGRALDSMELAATAAQAENAPDAYRFAREALDALRSACSQCEKSGNGYAGMCRNPGQGFRVKSSLADTLGQLCQALARQFGGQAGSGGAGLSGGDPANGYWMSGSSLLDVPLHGPARGALRPVGGRGRGHGGSGAGRGGTVEATERLDRQATEATPTRAVLLDEIPERYREPARLFYGLDAPPERSGPP